MASTGNNDLPILKVWWSHDISEINFGGISRAKKVHCVYSVAMNAHAEGTFKPKTLLSVRKRGKSALPT